MLLLLPVSEQYLDFIIVGLAPELEVGGSLLLGLESALEIITDLFLLSNLRSLQPSYFLLLSQLLFELILSMQLVIQLILYLLEELIICLELLR